jgi:hypothetical protein
MQGAPSASGSVPSDASAGVLTARRNASSLRRGPGVTLSLRHSGIDATAAGGGRKARPFDELARGYNVNPSTISRRTA